MTVELKVKGVRVRFDADERLMVSKKDLARSADPAFKQLALTDGPGKGNVSANGDGDGWVSAAEVLRTNGLYASTHDAFRALVHEANQQAFGAGSTTALRARLDQLGADPKKAPKPHKGVLKNLARSAFVPLAEHLAFLFARGQSYETSYGNVGDRVFHLEANALVRRYGVDQLAAACAILCAREGFEFGLAKRGDTYVLAQGRPDQLELDLEVTGFDLVFHTHPKPGVQGAQPSSGDQQLTQELDPDKHGAAVSEDGWWVGYSATAAGHDVEPARRLWRES